MPRCILRPRKSPSLHDAKGHKKAGRARPSVFKRNRAVALAGIAMHAPLFEELMNRCGKRPVSARKRQSFSSNPREFPNAPCRCRAYILVTLAAPRSSMEGPRRQLDTTRSTFHKSIKDAFKAPSWRFFIAPPPAFHRAAALAPGGIPGNTPSAGTVACQVRQSPPSSLSAPPAVSRGQAFSAPQECMAFIHTLPCQSLHHL